MFAMRPLLNFNGTKKARTIQADSSFNLKNK